MMYNRKYILPVLILVFGLWGTCEACKSLPGSPGISYEQQVSDSIVSVSVLPIADFIPEYGVNLHQSELYVPVTIFRKSGKRAYSSIHSFNLVPKNDSITFQKKIRTGVSSRYILITYTTDNEGNNEFLTVRNFKGAPEQILIKGPLGPFPYNSKKYACGMPFFDENSERLYFCSTMPGSMGGWDVYYIERSKDGWGAPHNMGKRINTPGNDVFPSVSNGFLIYSSSVRPGNKDFDNYIVKIGTGTSPVPMKLINTGQSDYCLRIASVAPFRAVGVKDSSLAFFDSKYRLNDLVNLMIEPDTLKKDKNSDCSIEDDRDGQEVSNSAAVSGYNQGKIGSPQKTIGNNNSVNTVMSDSVVQDEDIPAVAQSANNGVVYNRIFDSGSGEKDISKNSSRTTNKPVYTMISETVGQGDNISKVAQEEFNNRFCKIFSGYCLHYKTDSIIPVHSDRNLLDILSYIIEANRPCTVLVSGFADESGSGSYNDWLSYKRAEKMEKLLRGKIRRADDVRFIMVIYGNKFANGTSQIIKSKDRHVQVKIIRDTVPSSSLLYAYKITSASDKKSVSDLTDIFGVEQAQKTRINQMIESPESGDYFYVGIQSIHKVAPGESLDQIGQRYGCRVRQLRLANHLAGNKIETGEFLIIPFGRKSKL